MHRHTIRSIALVGALALLGSGCAWMARTSQTSASDTLGVSDPPTASANGRYVAYAAHTDATAPGVLDGVYRWDTVTNTRVLVSVSSTGDPGNDTSGEPAMSADGRYVAFSSDADNLVPNDTNLSTDVFVRDVQAGTTQRVSVTAAGAEVGDNSYTPSISDDGRYVAFISDSDDFSQADQNQSSDAYVVDRTAHTVTLASVAGGVQPDFGISDAVLSGDGKHLAFTTDTDLGVNDQNLSDDVYLRNLPAHSTVRVSRAKNGDVEAGGGFSPSLSYDGRYVAFVGDATIDGVTDPYPGLDVFVRDMTGASVVRASTTSSGALVDGFSTDPVLSSDGTRVEFMSTGNVSGTDTNGSTNDDFVKDLTTGKVALVSTDLFLNQLGFDSHSGTITRDGRYALYITAGKLTNDDQNSAGDAYMRAIDVPTVTGISPTTVTHGTSVTLTITGTNFLNGASVVPMGGIYTPTATTFVSSTQIKVTLAIDPAAPAGKQTIYVQNPGTGPGTTAGGVGRCENCLTVN